MANQTLDQDDEAPLDPTLARVQARLRRLMLISGLTLGVGIFAVLAAILYRIVTADASGGAPGAISADGAAGELRLSDLGLPADAALISTAVDGGRIVLTYAHTGGTTLIVLDAETLAVLSRLKIEP